MLLELLLALLLGLIAGTITGLTPAIHVNLVSSYLLYVSPLALVYFSPLVLVIFIVSMSITHTFLDFIPSIFLGAPDEDTGLSVLPGHEMLNQGKGYEAVILTLYGSLMGILIILLLTPLFIFVMPGIYPYLKTAMFFILVFISIFLIAREKESKFICLAMFILAGFLGMASFSMHNQNSLLPLLTGLFGGSSLITSMIKETKIQPQEIKKIKFIKEIKTGWKKIARAGFASMLSAPLCAFLPALGSSQAATIGSDIVEETDRKQFLIMVGAINTIIMGLSYVVLYSLNETRTGTAVIISKLMSSISTNNLLIILGAILISGILSFFIGAFLAKSFSRVISKVNYKYLSLFLFAFITLIVWIFSGFIGLLVFAVSTATGLTAILLGAKRTTLMGALMLPAIVLYFPF